MKGRRWSAEEDQLLRTRVLECITTGGTQLQAFEEIGSKLRRTAGACGFRWNAVLRQKDPASYSEAKKKRVYKELQRRKGFQLDSMSQVVNSLKQIGKQCRQLREDLQDLQQKLVQQKKYRRRLEEEKKGLSSECTSFDWYQKEVKGKYHDLVHFLDHLKRESARYEKNESINSNSAEIAVDTNHITSS